MHHTEPYGGHPTLFAKTWFGQGPNVVFSLAEQGEVPQGCHHGSLLTYLSRLHDMTKRGYGSCGPMMENQLFDIPFKPKCEFMR